MCAIYGAGVSPWGSVKRQTISVIAVFPRYGDNGAPTIGCLTGNGVREFFNGVYIYGFRF